MWSSSTLSSSKSLLRQQYCRRWPVRFHATLLHSESIGTPSSSTSSSILFLHGLLGNGRNLKTFAKQVCQLQNTQGHLLDLRGHGKSRISPETKSSGNHSFEACVQDIAYTNDAKFAEQPGAHPQTLVGHSWGGRMALQYAATYAETTIDSSSSSLKRIWLLDTVPGQAHSSVENVIDAVHQLQQSSVPPKDRQGLVETLTKDYGMDMSIAQWLASSFRNGDFGFDLEVVQDIMPEFETQDFYGLLQSLLDKKTVRVDLVRGGQNKGWDIQTLSKLESLGKTYPGQFQLHVLPKAGHWVHVDDLPGLVDLFAKNS